MGELYSSLFLPLDIAPAIVARIKILSNLKIDENRVPQDGRFSMKFDEKTLIFVFQLCQQQLGKKL